MERCFGHHVPVSTSRSIMGLVMAWHQAPVGNRDEAWVLVGTYEHHLTGTPAAWKITQLTFRDRLSAGNPDVRQHPKPS